MRRAVVFFTLLMLVGCTKKAANPATLLPQSAAGWTQISAPRSFSSEDLFKYVDGGAEKYIQAGVEQTSTAGYRNGDLEAVADLHRFRSADGPHTMMQSETGGEAMALGDEARAYGQAVVFRRGRYLVRVTGYQQTPQTKPALIDLGKAIDAKLR